MTGETLDLMVASIESALPSPKNYTEEAYAQLLRQVIYEVFGSRVEVAVLRAVESFRWNEETERWGTCS